MKKRILSFLVIFGMLFGLFTVSVGAESYWDAQKDYIKALESGDPNEIISAAMRIATVYSDPADDTEHMRLWSPMREAGYAYTKLGMFDKAADCFRSALRSAEYLYNMGYEDYYSHVNSLKKLISHTSMGPAVYAETADPSNIPFYNARVEAPAGTSHGMCGSFDASHDNARLVYVQFFNESIEGFSWQLPEGTDDYTLVIGWNVPNENYEDLRKIAAGEADGYIRENLEYLSTLKCDILIRFGAEINCWSSLPSNEEEFKQNGQKFIDTFKAAFRHVADLAEEYVPDVGMIYSPNDTSNWYFTPEDFYPGDEYVDWVGMSAYCNKSSRTDFDISNSVDAFYCEGDYYENQIVKISHIVEAFGDRKPIIITEGGYCYKSANGVQNTEHAAEAMKFFYTYVTRVYPQVKCIMYFNTNFGNNSYQIIGDGANAELGALYRRLVENDAAMQYSMGRGKSCGYTDILNMDEVTDALRLSVYAKFPTLEKVTVKYALDGKVISESNEYPYSCNIDTDFMGVGNHFLCITVTCLGVDTKLYYKAEVSSDSRVTVTRAIPDSVTDIESGFWGTEAIAFGMATGLFNGTSPSTFEPMTSLTRGMFVTILGRFDSVDQNDYKGVPFDDTAEGEWYTPYVEWAKSCGVVNGTSETTFEPNSKITREQICAIIVRYAEYKNVKLADGNSVETERFADHDKISPYAESYVYIVKNAGIVNGKGENLFDPTAFATRAEAATIMMRLAGICK